MQFPGSAPSVYTAGNHNLADGIATFDRLCLQTGFDKGAVDRAASEGSWKFTYRTEMIPFKEPVDIGGWNAPDATLRMADGIFFNKKAQCSFAFAPNDAADMGTIQEAMSKLIGSAPSNASKQFDKKGKPKKYYTPEWSKPGTGGAILKIFAYPLPYNGGAIQLAVLRT